jgi:hypothetical protein
MTPVINESCSSACGLIASSVSATQIKCTFSCRWKGIFPDALVFSVMAVFAANVALRVRQITHKHNRHLWRLLYEKTGLLLDVFIVALQASSK